MTATYPHRRRSGSTLVASLVLASFVAIAFATDAQALPQRDQSNVPIQVYGDPWDLPPSRSTTPLTRNQTVVTQDTSILAASDASTILTRSVRPQFRTLVARERWMSFVLLTSRLGGWSR